MTTTTASTTASTTSRATAPRLDRITRAVARRSFCTLATSSGDRPHVAGVLYVVVDDVLYVSTMRTSRKARNIVANPRVSVCIPIRRLPVGPPSSVQFAATAEILATTDPVIVSLAGRGSMKAITGHGELELADGCFLRITPAPRLSTYGLGLPLRRLIRDPLNAGSRLDRA
ncbi:MAG: pyridoxamine 5'-phosphate oxidase family protein [Acidimicrobiales bacterium]